MKTVVIILVTISAIVAFDIVTTRFFDEEMRYYNDNISSAMVAARNTNASQTINTINSIEEKWSSNKSKWNMMCDHAEIERITNLIYTAKTSYYSNNYEQVLVALEELRWSLKFTSMRYAMSLENIL